MAKKRAKKASAKAGGFDYAAMLVKAALAEDVGSGDITTKAAIDEKKKGRAVVRAKEPLTLAGINVAALVFKTFDKSLKCKILIEDGRDVKKGASLMEVSGSLSSILTAERVALNFLQRLSGIATLTSKYVKLTKDTRVKILDTRKTTPCLRMLEKYAVKTGGGANHRFGLFDAALIKDNHIAAAGSITKAVERVRRRISTGTPLEVETETLREVKEALGAGADIIMLDNMTTAEMKKAVRLVSGRAFTEASGGITLSNVSQIAKTGVDCISIGALTHSARSVDISLDVL